MTLCVISQWEQVTWQCSSYAGLLDPYPALVLYLAGDALRQQPMDSRSHDCSSYVGCGGIPCSTLVSSNASLHKWQQAVAPGWSPYMVPQNWIQARTKITLAKYDHCLFANGVIKPYFKSTQMDQLTNHNSSTSNGMILTVVFYHFRTIYYNGWTLVFPSQKKGLEHLPSRCKKHTLSIWSKQSKFLFRWKFAQDVLNLVFILGCYFQWLVIDKYCWF